MISCSYVYMNPPCDIIMHFIWNNRWYGWYRYARWNTGIKTLSFFNEYTLEIVRYFFLSTTLFGMQKCLKTITRLTLWKEKRTNLKSLQLTRADVSTCWNSRVISLSLHVVQTGQLMLWFPRLDHPTRHRGGVNIQWCG